MSMKRLSHIVLLALAMSLTPVADTSARGLSGVYARAAVSANEAAEIVRNRVGGKILAVETLRDENGTVYRVKILTRDAEVRVYHVDARSGAIFD